MLEAFLFSFATLFVIIDPIGIASISIGILTGFDQAQKRRVLIGAGIAAFLILTIFGLIGEALLHAIGIGIPAFRISGGLLLLMTAIEMLFFKRNERRQKGANEQADPSAHHNDPMIFPLAIPLMAGPGAMTSMILLSSQYSGHIALQSVVYVTLLVVILMTVTLALLANRFANLLGDTGIQVINRIFGVLLAALAVQFIADGIYSYITTHP